jgi:hypothetical protein
MRSTGSLVVFSFGRACVRVDDDGVVREQVGVGPPASG